MYVSLSSSLKLSTQTTSLLNVIFLPTFPVVSTFKRYSGELRKSISRHFHHPKSTRTFGPQIVCKSCIIQARIHLWCG
jgi:hypothetical protein